MENRESAKRQHERLEVWRDATDLAECVYRFSGNLPDSEQFGLTSQPRRAAARPSAPMAELIDRRFAKPTALINSLGEPQDSKRRNNRSSDSLFPIPDSRPPHAR